jgi:hypothetical protein
MVLQDGASYDLMVSIVIVVSCSNQLLIVFVSLPCQGSSNDYLKLHRLGHGTLNCTAVGRCPWTCTYEC